MVGSHDQVFFGGRRREPGRTLARGPAALARGPVAVAAKQISILWDFLYSIPQIKNPPQPHSTSRLLAFSLSGKLL